MTLTVSRCAERDVDDLVQFIDEEWEGGHVLVRSRALLDWQYRNGDGSYSFVLARHDGRLVGMLGYIATKRYDLALADANVIWLTTWKVRTDANLAALGLSLLQHLDKTEPHTAIGAIGFNLATRPMYAALGYRVGEMQHYVSRSGASTTPGDVVGVDVDDVSRCSALSIAGHFSGVVPRKTPRYFALRYLRHPFYRYRLVALRDRDTYVGVVAARVAEHGSLRALRIVDFLGGPAALRRSGAVIASMVREHDAAYADVYNAGIDADVFASAGFQPVDADGPEIVADHFEPFENRNVRLWYAIQSRADSVLFKGDADQDRPNHVPYSRPGVA